MKLKYLGTSAAEGIPTVACRCRVCEKARRLKGRYVRTRSQAMINDDMLLDFNSDSYGHFLANGINMLDINSILITHKHPDHFAPNEILLLLMPKFSATPRQNPLFVYGSEEVIDIVKNTIGNKIDFMKPAACKMFVPFTVCGKYTVTPLKANHGSGEGYYIYCISDGTKTVFYGHDSNYPEDITWEYLEKEKPYFNLVSLDCTRCANTEIDPYHMNLTKCASVKERMIETGLADENTVFVLNHFSHNGRCSDYDDMCREAEKYGFTVSYDGMEIEF